MQQQVLRFGQIISIKPTMDESMHVVSDGYIKTKAQLYQIESSKVGCGSLFFQSLFQVFPKFVTSRTEQVKNIGEEMRKSKYQKEAFRQQKLQEMEEKLIQEYKTNIETSKKNKGLPITYASVVQFLHLSSNRYLACNYLEATEERENFKLELNEYPSDNSCFRIQAAYSYQQASEFIYSNEPLYIIIDKIYLGLKPTLHIGVVTQEYDNLKLLTNRTLFNFPNEKTLQRKIQQGQLKYKVKMDPSNIQEPTTHTMMMPLDYKKKIDLEQVASSELKQTIYKKEVNVSLEGKSTFSFSIFTHHSIEDEIVQFGDVIWLHHIELNAILVTQKNPTDEIIVSLQQTKNEQLGEFIGNTNGMWYIEHPDLRGGPVEWGCSFRLRHFSLGKYLAIQREQNSCFFLEDLPSINSLINFLPLPSSVNDSNRYVTKDAFFKIKSEGEWVQFLDHETEVQIVMLRLSENSKDDDVLKCYKATLSEIQETSFLVSCFPVLRKSLIMLKHLQIKDLKKLQKQMEKLKFTKKIEQLQRVLQDLKRFADNQFLVSSQNRQKVLKEQYFIDILLEILQQISNEDEINQYLDQHKRSESLTEKMRSQVHRMKQSAFVQNIFKVQTQQTDKFFRTMMQQKISVIKMIYQLLISICKNHNENEAYVYQNVSKFQYQAQFFDETSDFIVSLLQNNENLLLNLTDDVRLSEKALQRQSLTNFELKNPKLLELNSQKKNLVLFYKGLVSSGKQSKKCLEFFRTISKFQNKGLSVNQEIIFKFTQMDDNFRQLFLPITISDKMLVKQVDFEPIESLSQSTLDYLVRQLNLYADLALSRNFLWRQHLVQIFPQGFLYNAIFEEAMPLELRSAFCSIALTTYIDHEPFNKAIVPNLCRVINLIPQKQDLDRVQILVEQVLKFIHQQQETLKENISIQAKQKQVIIQNRQVLQLQLDIIKLTSTLIKFNVISDSSTYSQILPSLIQFLEYDKNNIVMSYILNCLREQQIQQAKSLKGRIKGIVNNAIDIGRNLVNYMKTETLEEEFAEETLFSKHPIISSLLSLTAQLQQHNTSNDPQSSLIDIKIKSEICELMIFFQDLRLDFLITNFLAFYNNKRKKFQEADLITVLPGTLRTGIEEPKQKQQTNLFFAMGDVMSEMSKMIKGKKFTNYSDVAEMPDLDTLLSGECKQACLPSLLITFQNTQDSSLLDKVVEVIRRSFSQKVEMFQNLDQLEILFEQTDINSYQLLSSTLIDLRSLTESSEVWLTEFSKDSRADSTQVKKGATIVNILDALLHKHTVVTDDMELIQPENTIVSPIRQKVFTFMAAYAPLLNFIRDSQNQLAKILKDNFYSGPSKKAVLDLLKAIYSCLKNFCKNNLKNQEILANYIDLFLDEIEHDYGQLALVCSIYKNNKFLCQNVSEQRIRQILSFITNYGRQTRFLEFLKVIQISHKQSLVDNQLLLLQIILPRQNEEDSINEYWLYGQFQKQLIFDFRSTSQHKQINEPYSYHCKLIDVLITTTIGEESFKLNAPKLKQLFKLGYLIDILLIEDDLIPGYYFNGIHEVVVLKEKVILLINWIYLQNSLTHQEVIIREQAHFIKLFTLENARLNSLQNYEARYVKYFFTDLIQLFIQFGQKMITQQSEYKDREDYEQLRNIVNTILRHCDTLLAGQLNKTQFAYIREFFLVIDEQSAKYTAAKLVACLQQTFDLKSSFRKSGNEIVDEHARLLNKKDPVMTIFNSEEKKFLTQQLKSEVLNSKRNNSTHIWANQDTWLQFIKECKESTLFKEACKSEIRTLAYAIYRVDKLIPDNLRKNKQISLDFKSFVKKLIRYIEFGIPKKANKNNLIYSLRLLEEILTLGPLEEMQNILDQQNATKMILNIISEYKSNPFDDDFFDQLLSFGCKLLEGGNPKVQRTIFQYFSNLSKSENVFCRFHLVFIDHIDQLKVKYKMQNEKKQQEKEIRLDTEIEPDTHSHEEVLIFDLRESILLNLLRFIQLFCEGHNLELQNYIRQQFNSRNSYNLIQIIVELLYMYHFEITDHNYENIQKCLDTLTEFVQGPCTLNQQAIIDSKFLEVANTLLSMNIKKKKNNPDIQSDYRKSQTNQSFRSRGTIQIKFQPQIERYMLERIKYKVMVLVSSLLELNSDALAIKRIMRSLPIEILKKNLKQIYKKYHKLYGSNFSGDVLKHMDADPTDTTKSVAYFEVIIETGFYIYFLITYYNELDTQEVDTETATQLEKIMQGQYKENILMDNLLGQLIRFSYQIVKGVLDIINGIRLYFQQKFYKQKPKAEKEKLQMDQEVFKQTLIFFAMNSAHIEVVRNGQIECIHFYKPPYCSYLPDERKQEFHEKVNRDSTNAKITDLIDQTISIIQVCKHEQRLTEFFSKNQFIAIFANYVNLWKDLAFMLTIILNIFIILSYQATSNLYDERVNQPQLILYDGSQLDIATTQYIFNICGYIMISCSTCVVFFFLIKKAPLYVMEAWGNYNLSEYGVLINTVFQLFSFGYCIIKIILNIEVLYYLTFGILAFLATFKHPFFFAFHLTEVIIRFPTLRNIIKSIWEPKLALAMTFLLIILINYIFTIIGYLYFYDYYNGRCESLLYCFLETFDKAFKNNGGIGGYFEQNNPQNPDNYDYGRFFFDNLYNIAIVIIMMQIFSGIIIDTFSSLREKQMERDRDIQETCFICGFSRELFDRKSETGFKQHTQQEHYMWNYVFYISYLYDKEPTEYTGIESYVAQRLKNYDNSWLPINKALGLKNMNIENAQQETEQLDQIQGEMDVMKSNVVEILATMELLNNQY